MSKSLEQISEEYAKSIREKRGKILDDFFLAYAAQLSKFGHDVCLQDICMIEQAHFREGCLTRRYWFEYKPKFDLKEEK